MAGFDTWKWKYYFLHLLEKPELIQYDRYLSCEKRIYEYNNLRTVIIRNQDKTERILIFEEKKLHFEGEYDIQDKKIYVTSESMLKPLFEWMQLDVMDFIEQFAEKDRKGQNDELVFFHLWMTKEELINKTDEEFIKKEAEELWDYFLKCGNKKIENAVEMKKAFQFLEKKKLKNTLKETKEKKEKLYED